MGNDEFNESGFDGIDRDRAQRDIIGFYSEVTQIYYKIRYVVYDFFGTLKAEWGSPNAQTYTKDQAAKYYDIFERFIMEGFHIAHGAWNAANILLNANGEQALPSDSEPVVLYGKWNVTAGDIPVCDTDVNGIVGMDKAEVKLALDVFKKDLNTQLSNIDTLPTGISFYDVDGNLVETYNRNMKAFKDEATELLTNTSRTMGAMIETEINILTNAKKEAQDAMQD